MYGRHHYIFPIKKKKDLEDDFKIVPVIFSIFLQLGKNLTACLILELTLNEELEDNISNFS